MSSESPSRLYRCSPKENGTIEWPFLAASAFGRKSRGFTSDFSSGLTTEDFPVKGYPAKQGRIEIIVYILLDELTFHVDESHYPEATGLETPVTHLQPISCH